MNNSCCWLTSTNQVLLMVGVNSGEIRISERGVQIREAMHAPHAHENILRPRPHLQDYTHFLPIDSDLSGQQDFTSIKNFFSVNTLL